MKITAGSFHDGGAEEGMAAGSFREIANCGGMSLVELMVAIGVTAIIMALSTLIFLGQYKSFRTSHAVKTTESDVQKAVALVRDDLSFAGWGVKPQMAFYFVDGGASSPDEIYLNDISLINPNDTNQTLLMVDGILTQCGGCRQYLGASADADESYRCSAIKPGVTTPFNLYDINCDGARDLDDIPVLVWGDDFNATRVRSTDAFGRITNLTGLPTQTWVTPAIHYTVTDNATTRVSTLRRADRSTGGLLQPLAENVVDLQVVYGDNSTTPPSTNTWTPTVGWGRKSCSSGSCQLSPFDARKITWANLYVATRSAERVKPPSDPTSCRPAIANRAAGNSTSECGYEYKVYVARIIPLMQAERLQAKP